MSEYEIDHKIRLLIKRLDLMDKNINNLAEVVHKCDIVSRNAKIDTQHMYKIVKQMHKEHDTIMKLNGHQTLIQVIDELGE